MLRRKKISIAEETRAYAKLKQEVKQTGILDRAYGYYASVTTIAIGGFFVSFYQLYSANSALSLLLWSGILVFFMVQIGGIMHDAGHRAICSSVKMNDFFGHMCAGILGMPFGDWKMTHNKHHAHPNQEDEDPDIELPFISLTKERYNSRRGIEKLLRPYQAYLWYPIGSFVSFTKRLYGIKYFQGNTSIKTWWHVILYVLGLFVWFALPFVLFDLQKALIIFWATNLLFGFYLANIFAPNHKGMPQLKKGTTLSFLQHQVTTSRNIHGSFLTDILYIGLNYQIEHHLFPHCPRNKLKLLTPYVKNICRKMGLSYTAVGIVGSNKILLSELHHITKSTEHSH